MKKCILCGIETEGSIGAAGLKWQSICQPCKDAEDKALEERLETESKMWAKILPEMPEETK